MKKICSILVSCLLIGKIAFSLPGPVTTAGSVTICTDDLAVVAVTVSSFNDVGGISLTLNYDGDNFEFEDLILDPAITGSFTNWAIPGVFILSYTTSQAIDLPDGDTLLTLILNYTGGPSGGSSLVTWPENPPEANEYSTVDGMAYEKDPFENYFVNGSINVIPAGCGPVTIAPVMTTSLLTGIIVPVTVLNFSNVGGISLTMNYNGSMLAYQDVILNPAISTSLVNGSTPGVFLLSFTSDPGIGLDDGDTLFAIVFDYTGPVEGGTSPLTWPASPVEANEYSSPQGVAYNKEPFDEHFIAGSVTVQPVDLPSCPPASDSAPTVDGLLDQSYRFFKNYSSYSSGSLVGCGELYKFEDETYLYLAIVESRGVNDNVYGSVMSDVSYAGWTKVHQFKDLLNSDRVTINLFDQNEVRVFNVTFDYLFQQRVNCTISYNSGLLKFMPPGGVASRYDGSLSNALGYNNVVAAETSQDYNQGCNADQYAYNSPGPPEQGCWEYRVIHEMKIVKAGLGLPGIITDTSQIMVAEMHNSPPKGATAISGFKYCDADNDGFWDNDENGLGGITINLSGPSEASAMTDGNGFYEFFNLPAGAYLLEEEALPGFFQTQSPAPFTLSAHHIERDKNFGNRPTSLVLTCPGNIVTGPFQTQAEIDEAFAAWIATASLSGNCNPVLEFGNPEPPLACTNDTVYVTFTGQNDCEPPVFCSASFTLLSNFYCPAGSTTTPVVDGLLDPSYQLFKSVNLGNPSNSVYSRGSLFKYENSSYLYLAYVESRGVNDNVYGNTLNDVSYAGWTAVHQFSQLLSSDKLQVQLFNPSSQKVFDVTFDYLFQQKVCNNTSYNSALLKFMPSGGSPSKYDGSPTSAMGYNNVTSAETSLDYNQTCNRCQYNSDSPGPPEETSCWEYRMIYEIRISKSGLGLPEMITDTSRIRIPLVHNSPPKNATAINGVVYCDEDNNGAKDPSETGFEGWQVSLEGPVNASIFTNANGYYEFFNIETGPYTVTAEEQNGFSPTQFPVAFTLSANQVARDKNFGYSAVNCEGGGPESPLPVSIQEHEVSGPMVDIFPNPFKDQTEIRVISSEMTEMKVEIYTIQGQKLQVLFDGTADAGVSHIFRFGYPDNQPGQVLICIVSTPGGNVIRKIIHL